MYKNVGLEAGCFCQVINVKTLAAYWDTLRLNNTETIVEFSYDNRLVPNGSSNGPLGELGSRR